MASKLEIFAALVFLAVAVSNCNGALPTTSKKDTLGIVEIFNHFIEKTNLIDGLPHILQRMGAILVHDIRGLIFEAEKLLRVNNITQEAHVQLGKVINATFITEELLPQLEEVIESNNITDVIEDIRKYLDYDKINQVLLDEVDNFLESNNITSNLKHIFQEIRKEINEGNTDDEILKGLDDFLKATNITLTIDELLNLINVTRLFNKFSPLLDDFLKESNMSQVFKELREAFNVTKIASDLLPLIEDSLKDANLTAIAAEVGEFLDMGDISWKLIPTLERIFRSNNVSSLITQVDYLLNLTHIASKLLPELGKVLDEINITGIIGEVRKSLDVTVSGGQALDELEKELNRSEILKHVPELAPFLNISLLRNKLGELERIIDYLNISEILDEVEKHLDMNYLISKVPELGSFLESTGISDLLVAIKSLGQISLIGDTTARIETFLLSANLSDKIDDLEKFLNVTYMKSHIVPEFERMFQYSNLSMLIDELEKALTIEYLRDNIIPDLDKAIDLSHEVNEIRKFLDTGVIKDKIVPEIEEIMEHRNLNLTVDQMEKLLNTSYLSSYIVPEIIKILKDLNTTEQLHMLLDFFNTTYLKQIVEELDKQFNITNKGEQIADGDLPGVVNGIIDQIFKKEKETPHAKKPTTKEVDLRPTTLPPVCTNDCNGVPCGTAMMNGCQRCVLGNTGRKENHGKDCNNVCSGRARNDSCGACTNPPLTDRTGRDSPFADCHGTCFGSALMDSCGKCSGGDTGKAFNYSMDACGVCGGDNSSCAGCDGVPNSGKVNDSCMVCGGDGSTCTTISSVVPSLLPTSSDSHREVTVHGAGLDGTAVKCFLDGVEISGAGSLVDRTHCKCTIPSGNTAGSKVFTVKVVKGGADVSTADLTLQLYDSSSTKITSLVPAEMLTGQTTTVIFNGQGLVSSSTAVCIMDGPHGDVELPASSLGGMYTCTVPAMTKSMATTIYLSLNKVHKLPSDVPLARTIFSPAPVLRSAHFSDTGARIHAKFDKDVNRSSLASCDDIFASATVQLFGNSPLCTWSDAQNLIIVPGDGASVLPSHNLALKTAAIKSGGEMFSKYASGSASVAAPVNAERPVPVIKGPSQISSCGHLSLDASQSSGRGGRPMDMMWTLVSPSNPALSAVLNAARNNSRVFINGTLMTAGQSYTIRLGVKNFLTPNVVEKSIVVAKATNPLPEVTVTGPMDGKVSAGQTFFIVAKAKAAICSSDRALKFTWTVTSSNNAAKLRAENSEGFKASSSKPSLKIDSGSLFGGVTYQFTVVVALKSSPTTETTITTSVQVEWSPLRAAIRGGESMTVGRDSGPLVFDAKSVTVDPDNAPGELSCSWTCVDKLDNQPCYSAVTRQKKVAMLSRCVVTVQSSHFNAGRLYEITVQVSKGSRTGSASMVLDVHAGQPPVVKVISMDTISASDEVKLLGGYKTALRPTALEWVSVQDQDHRYVDLSDSSLISSSFEKFVPNGKSIFVKILKANVLTAGEKYKFELKVNDGSSVGSASMVVQVRAGIQKGRFNVSRTTLDTLQEITLEAPDWDTDADARPLTYEYGYRDSSGRIQIWTRQYTDRFSIPAPPGHGVNHTLPVFLRVRDKKGSEMVVPKYITVRPATTLDEGLLTSQMNETVKEAENSGDYTGVFSKLNTYLQAAKMTNNTPASLLQAVTSVAENAIAEGAGSSALDPETADPMLTTLRNIKPDLVKNPKKLISGLKHIVKASSENMDKDTIDDTLAWAAGISTRVDLQNATVLEDLEEIDRSLGKRLLTQLEFGQAALETAGDNPRLVITAVYTIPNGTMPAKSGTDATEVNFGDEVSQLCEERECAPGEICMGCKIIMNSYKQDIKTDTSPDKPNVVPEKIVDFSFQNPATGEDMAVSGLSQPIEFTFKLESVGGGENKYFCVFYDEATQRWSTEGLSSRMNGVSMVASSTHLTSFAPAEQTSLSESDDDDDNTNLIIGAVVGATLGVAIIALVVAWLVHRNQKSTKVSSMTPPINSYDNEGQDNHAMTPV